MRVITQQNVGIMNLLLKRGIYYSDILRENYNYSFIKTAMVNKGIIKSIESPIVWGWSGRTYDEVCNAIPTQLDEVCLELEVPDELCLLSDYSKWTCAVLNDSFWNNAEEEKDFDQINKWFESLSLTEKYVAKIQSWQHIFNLDSDTNWVQATFPYIKREWILSIIKEK